MLKASIVCTCGCKYELFSTSKHDVIKCPNCSEVFRESEKLISILEIFASMDLEKEDADYLISDKIFSHPELMLSTVSENEITTAE